MLVSIDRARDSLPCLPTLEKVVLMEGYIKDWRRELESDIWFMPPIYHRIWQYLKYIANHHDEYVPMRDGTKILVKRGQKLTSVRSIAEGVGWYERGIFRKPNPKTVQDVLNWLVANGMISIDTGNRKYTLITIEKYCIYQAPDDDESNRKVTEKKQSLDINNNEKNEKNNLKNIYAEQVQQVFDFYLKTFDGFFKTYSLTADRKAKIEARLKEGYTVEQICTAIRNIRQSPFHCGENDRHKFYADIAFICRSGSKVEEWINYVPNGNSIAGNMPVIDYEAAKKSKYGW